MSNKEIFRKVFILLNPPLPDLLYYFAFKFIFTYFFHFDLYTYECSFIAAFSIMILYANT